MKTEIHKFTKKSLEIEAYQITRSLLEEVLFDDKPYPKGLQMTSSSYHKERREISAWFGEVTTIHNEKTKVVQGDWIITEPDGVHHYPCKPEIFEATYFVSSHKEEAKSGFEKHLTFMVDHFHQAELEYFDKRFDQSLSKNERLIYREYNNTFEAIRKEYQKVLVEYQKFSPALIQEGKTDEYNDLNRPLDNKKELPKLFPISEGKPLEEITDEEISNLLDCAQNQKPFNKMTRLLYSLWNKLSSVPVTEAKQPISDADEFDYWINKKGYKSSKVIGMEHLYFDSTVLEAKYFTESELYSLFLRDKTQ